MKMPHLIHKVSTETPAAHGGMMQRCHCGAARFTMDTRSVWFMPWNTKWPDRYFPRSR
jgi:hypothetical protein